MDVRRLLRDIRAAWPLLARASRDPSRALLYARKAVAILRAYGLQGIRDRLHERARARQRDSDYAAWVAQHDELTPFDREAIGKRVEMLGTAPLFSVLLPVYDTPEPYLRRCIDSVRRQLYPTWELSIADDGSTKEHVGRTLREYAAADPRIRVVFRDSNGHISAASNSALAIARGDYIALLDHDDELAEHALYVVAEEIRAHPDAVVVYSDEDKLSADGRRFEPYFKPDWNADLFYAQNMVSHLGVYRTDAVRAVGGFRLGFEGSQDYDVALRVLERVRVEQVRHIPMVLYHWRAIPGSTSMGLEHKTYAETAARRALQEHFDRTGSGATISQGPSAGLYRAVYALPRPAPLVSIVIPTRDRVDLLERCIGTLEERTDYPSYEIVIVDNGSREARTLRYLRRIAARGEVRVVRDDAPFNHSALNNLGASKAKGDVLAFLNNDVEPISRGWLTEMVSHALRPEIGAVGAKLYSPDGRVLHAGIIVGMGAHAVAGTPHRGAGRSDLGHFGRAQLTQCVSAVTGACIVMRKGVFVAVGGFDARALPVAYNDVDLCLKVRAAGYRVLFTPYAELLHRESASRGADDSPEKQRRLENEAALMRERWGEVLARDPYYNPNLALDSDDFSLAWPPRVRRPWRPGGS
jgi:GT2 family glycosyltransferase